jgi:hypothetical protein
MCRRHSDKVKVHELCVAHECLCAIVVHERLFNIDIIERVACMMLRRCSVRYCLEKRYLHICVRNGGARGSQRLVLPLRACQRRRPRGLHKHCANGVITPHSHRDNASSALYSRSSIVTKRTVNDSVMNANPHFGQCLAEVKARRARCSTRLATQTPSRSDQSDV